MIVMSVPDDRYERHLMIVMSVPDDRYEVPDDRYERT
jgi:hypothetical protein